MLQKTYLSALILVSGLVSLISAQTPEAKSKLSLAKGDVVSITAGKIVLQTESGAVDVPLTEKTEYLRLSADNPSLKTATAGNFAEIGAGDKVAVTGFFSEDKKTLPAYKVYLLTKSDIAQKQAKESEQWRTRGISGRVVSVNQQASQISIEVRGLASSSTINLTAKHGAKFKRYAPNSVSYSEAKMSSLSEIKTGDMLRALGEKSADGTSFTAEEVLTGAFQTVAGTVKSIDAAKNEVVITDILTKKDVIIAVGAASTLKKFPEEMAQRMAMMQAGGGAAGMVRPGGGLGSARPPQAGNQPTGNTQAGNTPNPPAQPGQTGVRGNGFGGGTRGGQGGIDDMLERFPNITINDLKVGDSIAVSSTKNAVMDRITAIKLLAGVEPFLKSAQAPTGGQRSGQGGQGGGFTIPGLDGNIP